MTEWEESSRHSFKFNISLNLDKTRSIYDPSPTSSLSTGLGTSVACVTSGVFHEQNPYLAQSMVGNQWQLRCTTSHKHVGGDG